MGGVEVHKMKLPSLYSLTSKLIKGEWPASRPNRITLPEWASESTKLEAGWDPERYGRLGEERQLFPLPETERRFIGCEARSLVTRGLSYPSFCF
jgi:hypothetical protein